MVISDLFSDTFVYTNSFGGHLETLSQFLREQKISLIWNNCFEGYWLGSFCFLSYYQVRDKISRLFGCKVYNLYLFRHPEGLLEHVLYFCREYFTERDAFAFIRCLAFVDDYVFSGLVYFKGKLLLGTHFYNLRYVFDFYIFCSLLGLECYLYNGSRNVNGVWEFVKSYARKNYFFNQGYTLSE